jgi:hypothetical protein
MASAALAQLLQVALDEGPRIAFILGVWLVVCRVWRWIRPSATVGAQLLAELDAGPDWNSVGVTTRYQRELAYRFKAEFGELRYNKANRIIASSWVLKTMAGDDVRYVDRVKLEPLAVQLCLLPTQAAVTAARIAQMHEVCARRSAVELPK